MNPRAGAADEGRSAERPQRPAPLVIGVTGGIGSGKSAAAGAFAALGVPVTDTDRLAHALCEPGGAGHRALREAWTSDVFRADGTLDRAALRRQVFADAAARARLEALLHPLIAAAAQAEIATWRAPYGLLVVPLLIERGGLRRLVTRILVVDCPEPEQVRRVVARSGLAAAEVQAIMATQVSRASRLAAADDVVDNAGPVDCLPPQVALLDRRYRALAGAVTN